MTALKGIIAPFTTPFKANGEIDIYPSCGMYYMYEDQGNKEGNLVPIDCTNIRNNKVHLIPANKNYKEKIVNIDEIQIQGILTGIIRKYN